jgi:hypothetical protein
MRVRAWNKAPDGFPVGNQSDGNREARLRARHTKICAIRNPCSVDFPRLAVGLHNRITRSACKESDTVRTERPFTGVTSGLFEVKTRL